MGVKMMCQTTIPSAQKRQCERNNKKKRAEVAGRWPDSHGPGSPWMHGRWAFPADYPACRQGVLSCYKKGLKYT